MKQIQFGKYLLLILVFGLTSSCINRVDPINRIFTEAESQTIDKIIKFYDKFIIANSDSKLSTEKAYINFLDKNCPLAIEVGDLGLLLPDLDSTKSFLQTLDKKTLSEIYNIKDTSIIIDRNTKEKIKVYTPFSFSLNYQGKYIELLEELSHRNDFFENYYQQVISMGDLSVSNYSLVLKEYKNIDFSKKEEKLVLIINLLHAQ